MCLIKVLLPFRYSLTTTNVINLYPYSFVLCVESTHPSEPNSLNKSAWNGVISTNKKLLSLKREYSSLKTPWGLYAMTGLGFSSWSSCTILSTETASFVCLWLVKSRMLRQTLRQSCCVIKCFLETVSSNSFRWCLSPISSLMSKLQINCSYVALIKNVWYLHFI